MRHRIPVLLGALALMATSARAIQAQTHQVHLGPRLSYHFDAEEIGLGVQMGIPLTRHLEFYPSIDNFFVDAGSFVSLNADLKLRVPLEASNWLYVGTGVNFARTSFRDINNTRTGLNVFLGAESRKGRVHPFGEIRFISNDGTSAQGAIGLNITMDD